jgi:hypothetical protein
MSEKNYLGNGWQNTKYPDMINVSINLEKLMGLTPNEYGDVKITVSKMKQPNSKTKATHTVYENDYNPQRTEAQDRQYDKEFDNAEDLF